jgi:hypothetical protein
VSGTDRGWTDLAANKAGAGVSAEAKALRKKAPVRAFVARLFDAHTDERAWRLGAEGEQLVAAQLERLGSAWHIIHSVTLSETGTDLDHLVIGPGGVFCLNTKNHPGARVWVAGDNVYVNGHRPEHNYVRASRAEGRKVTRLLTAAWGSKVVAQPVVVVAGAIVVDVKEQPPDVYICSRRQVTDWLCAQPRTLTPEAVAAIFTAARRSITWVPEPKPTTRKNPVVTDRAAPGRASSVRAPGTVSEVPAVRPELVIKHSPTKGTTLHGDPRPHTKLVSSAGLQWSARQRLWYLPDSRDMPAQVELIRHLGHALGMAGFQVTLEIPVAEAAD